jgi:DNA repair exonuclease SbcCD ATPase subunit
MKIKKIEFKNINSYGNNIQTIDCFNEDGSLILLHGDNGYGKSTIKQVMDVTIFSKTTGKNGKRLAVKELPNRRNGAMYSSIIFENHLEQLVQMKRWIKPNDFEISVNNEIMTERFKKMTNKEREKIIGYSYDIFKSFISININDFKNFISLNKEDKETLLNKLFNLNELDDLHSITKELDKANQTKIYEYDNLILENDSLIIEYNSTITKIKESQQFSKEEKLADLKQQILDLKPEYLELNEQIKQNQEKKDNLNRKNIKLRTIKLNKEKEKTKIELEIENLGEKIETYNSGICPVCDTILTDDSHLNSLIKFQNEIKIKETLINKCDQFLNKCVLEDTKIRNNNDTLYKEKVSLNQRLTEIKILLGSLNKEYKELKQ